MWGVQFWGDFALDVLCSVVVRMIDSHISLRGKEFKTAKAQLLFASCISAQLVASNELSLDAYALQTKAQR